MPIILATLEEENGRIVVRGQIRQKVSKTPSQLITGHSNEHASVILVTWEAEIRKIEVPGQPRKKVHIDLISIEKASCDDDAHLSSQHM
jgi:hypothetical protein